MAEVTRRGLQLIAERLGRAYQKLNGGLGDLARHPGARLDLESALCRLRTATHFHDRDEAREFLTFDEQDLVGLGIQGGLIGVQRAAALSFPEVPSGGHWTPYYYGPPCTEGWGVWKYNAWKYWTPVDEEGDEYYTVNPAEPTSGSGRLTQEHPVRWNAGSSSYEKALFFERARWISFQNNTGDLIDDASLASLEFVLAAEALEGIQATDHLTDKPLDLIFYGHPYLVQERTGENVWSELDDTPSFNETLTPLGMTLTKDVNGWLVNLNIPAGIEWPDGYWLHVAMCWGSLEDISEASIPELVFDSGAINVQTPAENETIYWPRKNFFRAQAVSALEWQKTGVNDSSVYLTSQDRTHFAFVDGQYSSPEAPTRYKFPTAWPAAALGGFADSLEGYLTLDPGNVAGVLLCSRNQGSAYEEALASWNIVVGAAVPSELWPGDWRDFAYYPDVPQDHEVIARLVVGRNTGALYGLPLGVTSGSALFAPDSEDINANLRNVLGKLAVHHYEQAVHTYARPPHGDADLASTVLPAVQLFVTQVRSTTLLDPILNAAFRTIVPAAQVTESLAPNRDTLDDPADLPSKIFLQLLKKPSNPLLQNPDNAPPRAIPFEEPARNLIEGLAGLPPSTEMARLEVDELSLSGAVLPVSNVFEIYHEPSSQCEALDPNSAGIALGQDYTLRLVLEDAQENTLTKDLYVMASRYLLADAEYERRVSAEQSVTGYFRRGTQAQQDARAAGTLQTIGEFRLHGYAGLVPDLTMGDARKIYTRVVSPEDETRVTEEQFRKNLENQGYSEDEINERVLQFLEDGGEFYTIDLHQYDNRFVALRDIAVSVAQYAFGDVPYWTLNQLAYFGLPELSGTTPPSVADVRADSFTLAPNGLAAGDLEQFGSQSSPALDAGLNHTTAGTDYAFADTRLAFKVVTTQATYVSSFGVRLQSVLDVENEEDTLLNGAEARIVAHLYADNDGLPGARLATGGSVLFSYLEVDAYNELLFSLPYSLMAGSTYWIVLELSTAPVGGDIEIDVQNTGSYLAVPDADTVWETATGRPWVKFYQVQPTMYGHFNRDAYSTRAYLPPPNNLRSLSAVYKVDGHWAYTCRRLPVAQQMALYPRAFYDSDASLWRYARFDHDVHVCVRYLVDGRLRTRFYQFERSPGWQALWWQRAESNYNVLDTSASPVDTSIQSEIDYASVTFDGESDYLNARFTGAFSPVYNEVYTLSVTSDGGVRVYVDNELVINAWENGALSTFTYNMGTLSTSAAVSFVVEYWHATGAQQLTVEWESATQTLGTISPLTAQDPDPDPLLLDTDPVEAIVYLSVGKALAEIDTITHGAPPGDTLVIRSY